ncbi:MAG: carboxypeptidase regulatory-like domain-containing protein [Candidatus Caldarchaeum sp.]|nr:carboxypeptidase regulatory-like domain-containing protein [Candidatus Caldarchaeum sp.]
MGLYAGLRAVLLTATVLASCFLFLASLPQAEASSWVVVTVRTADTNEPVRGARISVNGTDKGPTGVNGNLNVTNINRKANSSLQVYFRGFVVYNNPVFNATRINPSNPSQVTIRVNVTTMVVDIRTALGNPVPNVRLTIVYDTYTNTTTTGADGRATLPFMPNTTYTISARYRGHDVGTFNRFYRGAPLTINVNLYSIRAEVQDFNGNPIPSATVRIWYGARQSGNTTGFASGETDSNGIVILDRLPAGDYPLNVEYRGETVYQTTTNIQVIGGQVNHVARTDLVQYSVKILDHDGVDLMTGIRLEARLFRDNNQYGDTVTSSTGEFSFGLVRSRGYILVVRFGDVEVFRGEVNAPATREVRGRFFDVSVRVDASGTPSERLVSTVGLRLSLGNYVVEATTTNAAAGFRNLPAGSYRYEITRGPYSIGTGTVEVNADEARISIRPTLHTVRINIKNDQNEGIPASTQLKTYDDIVIGTYQAGENGVVSVSGLLPILYRGTASFRGVVVNDGYEFVLDQNNKEITVATRVYRVVFRVLDFDGEAAVPDAETFVSLGEINERAVSNSSGRVLFRNLPSGSYNIRVNYLNTPVHEETLRIDASREITIKARNVIDVVLEAVDDDAAPLDSGEVEVILGAFKNTGTISNGRVRFENIPAGAYRVLIRYKGLPVYDRQVSFRSDEELAKVSAAVYYVRMNVEKADGTALATAYVSALQGGRKLGDGFTDQAGRLELKLPRGEFTLEISYQDTKVATQSISLSQSTLLNIKSKVYRVDVRLLKPNGEPVQGAEVSLSRGNKIIEKAVTNEEGRAKLYVAEGDYSWTMKIGGYTYTSSYSSKANKELAIVHVEENPQWQGVVLAATAAVSASSVFGLLRWGRLKPSGRQRSPTRRQQPTQQQQAESRAQTFKRPRPPRV